MQPRLRVTLPRTPPCCQGIDRTKAGGASLIFTRGNMIETIRFHAGNRCLQRASRLAVECSRQAKRYHCRWSVVWAGWRRRRRSSRASCQCGRQRNRTASAAQTRGTLARSCPGSRGRGRDLLDWRCDQPRMDHRHRVRCVPRDGSGLPIRSGVRRRAHLGASCQ